MLVYEAGLLLAKLPADQVNILDIMVYVKHLIFNDFLYKFVVYCANVYDNVGGKRI